MKENEQILCERILGDREAVSAITNASSDTQRIQIIVELGERLGLPVSSEVVADFFCGEERFV